MRGHVAQLYVEWAIYSIEMQAEIAKTSWVRRYKGLKFAYFGLCRFLRVRFCATLQL